MAIPFKCTSCGRGLQAKPEMAGKKTKCPGCQTILTIPSAAPAAAAAPAGKPPAAKTAPAININKAAPPASPAPAAAAAVVACECGAKIRTKPEWAGKTIKCPKCDGRIKVPTGAPAAAPVPAAAPARPAPKPAPAPIDEDDPFAGGIPGPGGDEPFGGGAEGFSDDGDDQGYEEPVSRPARKSTAPPPKKGGGFLKLLLILLLLILLAAGGFVAYGYFVEGLMPMDFVAHLMGTAPVKTPPVIPAEKKVPKTGGDDTPKDPKDDEPKEPDAKAKDPESKDPKDPEPKDPKDPVPPTDPAPKDVPPAKAGDDAKLLNFVAGDNAAFFSLNPQAVINTPKVKEILSQIDAGPEGKEKKIFVDILGVDVGDVLSIVGAYKNVPMPDGGNVPGVYFIATAKPTNADGFEKLAGAGPFGKKTTTDGRAYYTFKGPKQTFAIVGAGTKQTLVGDEAEVLAYMSAGKLAPGGLTETLKSALATDHLAFVGFQLPKDFAQGLLAGAPKEAQDMLAPFAEMQSGQVLLTAGNTVKLALRLTFADDAKADAAKKTLDMLLAMGKKESDNIKKGAPPEVGKHVGPTLDSIAPKVEGATLEVPLEIKLSLDELAELLIRQKKAGPFGDVPQAPKAGVNNLDNLKLLGLAMHSYHDAFNRFPNANQGLVCNWRIALLPFMEEQALYEKFEKLQPWDKETNKKLIEAMPPIFKHPTRPAPPGHTYYRVFVGPQTIFPDMKGTRIPSITDGTSNTILIVEARDPVIWTKPDELVYDPKGPLPALGDGSGAISFVTADGAVQVLWNPTEDHLRAFITATGGEVIDLEKKTETKSEIKRDLKIEPKKQLDDEPTLPKLEGSLRTPELRFDAGPRISSRRV